MSPHCHIEKTIFYDPYAKRADLFCNGDLPRVKNIAGSKTPLSRTILHKIEFR